MSGINWLMVYAILQSGIAAISGVTSSSDAGTAQALSNFSIGMLSGYGARDAFIWLDSKVENIFSTRPKQEPPPEPAPHPNHLQRARRVKHSPVWAISGEGEN